MKQELLCEQCAIKLRKLFPTDQPYPGEFVDFKHGIVQKPNLVCDDCTVSLERGSRAIAYSNWVHGQRIAPWAMFYLYDIQPWEPPPKK